MQDFGSGDTSSNLVGGIQTKSVSWKNVKTAIDNLKELDILNPEKLHHIDFNELDPLIRSSRFYNEKAKKIKNFMNFFFDEYDGDLSKMSDEECQTKKRYFFGKNY